MTATRLRALLTPLSERIGRTFAELLVSLEESGVAVRRGGLCRLHAVRATRRRKALNSRSSMAPVRVAD